MSRLNRICICTLIVCVAFFASPLSALAIPALPSSFYGTVKLNNANVPDGTVIQAFNGEKMIAQGYTQTYQGDSVYSLDIPGDNTDTPAIDGGREGDTITFKVGGLSASQTGIWHSATNVQLNLNVTSTSASGTPQATPTNVPTQTPIVVIQRATKTPKPAVVQVLQASSTAIISVPTQTLIATQTPIIETQPASKTPRPAALTLPTAIIPSLAAKSPGISTSIPEIPTRSLPVSDRQTAGDNKNTGNTILIMALATSVILGAGFIAWIRRRK